MEVRVLYFAAARERAGLAEETLDLADGETIAGALAKIVARHEGLAPLMPYVRVAHNEEYASDDGATVAAGDVLALIPPVAGGAPLVALQAHPLDARAVEALVAGPDRGGLVTFTGAVRDHTGDHAVVRLEYEAYGAMAERQLERIRLEAVERFPGVRVAVHHRLGVLAIGEAAVVVAAAAPHRRAAFDACQYVIDRLKEDVPIFKREVRGDGSVWVGLGP